LALAGSGVRTGDLDLESTAAECSRRSIRPRGLPSTESPPPVASPARTRRVSSARRRIVPSSELPRGHVQAANNNLDVVRHSDGGLLWSFRSAPNHFASVDTVVYVVTVRTNRLALEARFALGRDLREPRLFVVARAFMAVRGAPGRSQARFFPQGISFAEQRPAGGSANSRRSTSPASSPGVRACWANRPLIIGLPRARESVQRGRRTDEP